MLRLLKFCYVDPPTNANVRNAVRLSVPSVRMPIRSGPSAPPCMNFSCRSIPTKYSGLPQGASAQTVREVRAFFVLPTSAAFIWTLFAISDLLVCTLALRRSRLVPSDFRFCRALPATWLNAFCSPRIPRIVVRPLVLPAPAGLFLFAALLVLGGPRAPNPDQEVDEILDLLVHL